MRYSSGLLTLCLLLFFKSISAQVPTFTTHVHPNAPGGYYFISPFTQNMSDAYQMVLDSSGQLQYYLHMNGFSIDFKQLPGGGVSYWKSPYYYILNPQLQKIDSLTTLNNILPDEHDIQLLPNGNYLIMGFEYRTMDLSHDSIFMAMALPGSKYAAVKAVVIQEVTPTKQLAFEWKAADHLPFNTVDDFFVFDSANVDWTHSNAIELDHDGHLLLSSRHLNEITKINRQTGDVIWRFGGKYNNFTFIGDTVPFYGQHDVRRLPNGHLTLFDNGRNKSNRQHGARAVEYILDESNFTAKLVRSYGYYPNQFSIAMGNVQSPDSTIRLVNYGIYKDFFFNVIDKANVSVFEMEIMPGYYNYRAFLYKNLPLGMQSPPLLCADSAGVIKLTIAGNSDAAYWSNGQFSTVLTVTTTGEYFAMVKTPEGGFVKSQILHLSELSNFCSTTNIQNNNGLAIHVYPNPTQSLVNVKGIHFPTTVHWYNLQAIEVFPNAYQENEVTVYDFTALEKGLYFLKIDAQVVKLLVE